MGAGAYPMVWLTIWRVESKSSRVPGPWLTTRPALPLGSVSTWCGEAPVEICPATRRLARSTTWTASMPATVT